MKLSGVLLASAAVCGALVISDPADAYFRGYRGAGWHGGGWHGGGWHGGGWRGAGWRGAGWRGVGWRGARWGWGGRWAGNRWGWNSGWGWGLGTGLGLAAATSPWWGSNYPYYGYGYNYGDTYPYGYGLAAAATAPVASESLPPADKPEADKSHAEGASLFAGACAGCHAPGAPMMQQGRPSLALGTPLHEESPRDTLHVIMNGLAPPAGRAGPTMPGFADSLSDSQLVAIAAYLRARFTDHAPWPDLDQTVTAIRQSSKRGGT